jgi:hypothetical protein
VSEQLALDLDQLVLDLEAEAYDVDGVLRETAGVVVEPPAPDLRLVEEAPRSRPTPTTRKVFTVLHFAEAAGLDPETAREFLAGEEGFEERGIVERVPGGWRFTAEGRQVGRDLLRWIGDKHP